MEQSLPFDLNSLSLNDLKGLVEDANERQDPIFSRLTRIYWIRRRETMLSEDAIRTLKENSQEFSEASLQVLLTRTDLFRSPKFIRTETRGIFFPDDKFQHIDYAFANGLWEPLDAGFLRVNERLRNIYVRDREGSVSLGIIKGNPHRTETVRILQSVAPGIKFIQEQS